MTDAPEFPNGIIPIDWEFQPSKIRYSISMLDEFGLPYDKRGFTSEVPRPNGDVEGYADGVAKLIRDTIVFVLTGREPGVDET